MAKAYYEIWKTDSTYTEELQQIYFKEVSVKKEMMKLTTFYFNLDRNAETALSAPAIGDYIKIFRNNEEILRGQIEEMDIRDESIHYEGYSISYDWAQVFNGTYIWKNTGARNAIETYATRLGWAIGTVDNPALYNHTYPYVPLIEELELFSSLWDKEFYFDEINKKIDFKDEVGTDKSADIRFVRGVNIESFGVKREKGETWTQVIALGAGEGKNQLKVVVGTEGDKHSVKVFTDKQIKDINDLTSYANKKLAEGAGTEYVTYEARILSPIFGVDIGDKVWVEDSLNRIDEAMRIMAVNMTFNETEQFDVVLANKNKTLIDLFKKMEKGQRTLNNVHHSSAVQPNSMIQVDDEKNPIKMEVQNDNFVNTTSGNDIGTIESNVSTAQSTASSAQADATNAQTTANTANQTASTANQTANTALQTAESKEDKFYKQATEPPHAEGRIWIHTGFNPNIMYRSEAGQWIKMTATQAGEIEGVVDEITFEQEMNKKQNSIPMGTTAPSAPVLNDLWLDTSSIPYVLKRYDGTAWQKASPTNANEIGAEALMPKDSLAPATPFDGQLWLDTSATPNILKRYDGATSQWVKATPTSASEVGSYDTATIDTKVGTAEGKADDAKALAEKATGTGQHVYLKTPDTTSNVDYADYAHGLYITVDEDVHLGYATVFAEVAGSFVAQLRLPDWTVLEEKWYYLEIGENKINLDFLLTKEQGDYMLFGDATDARTQRTLPAGVSFPYESGSVHITGTTSTEGYWYHFYKISAGGAGVVGDLIGTVDGTDIKAVKDTADTAKTTAENADSKADTAQQTASNADSKATTAQQTADSKAKTFTSTPTVPYKVGDIWKNGASTYVCIVARATGSYTASDWEKTGDVTANNTSADTSKVAGVSATTVKDNAQTAKDKTDTTIVNVNGTYFVDGGTLLAESVGADSMKANSVTAEKLNIGLGVQGSATGNDTLSLHTSATYGGGSGTQSPLRDFTGTEDNNYYTFGSGNGTDTGAEGSYMYVDLGLVKEVGALKLWFFSGDARSYFFKVKVSQDGTNWYYLIGNSDNNSWSESNPNKELDYPTLISFPPIKIRYIRLYGNGNTVNTANHIHAMQIYNKMPVGAVSNSDGTVVINDSGIQVSPNAGAEATTTINKEGVSVKDGSFYLSQGDMTGLSGVQTGDHQTWEMTDEVAETWSMTSVKPMKYTLEKQTNLFVDHSFEMFDAFEGTLNATDNHFDMPSEVETFKKWGRVGSVKLYSVRNTDLPIWSAFGLQSVVTDSTNYVKQQIDVEGGEWYTVSAHLSAPTNLPKGTAQIYFKFWGDDVQVFGSTNYANFTVPTTVGNQSQRVAVTFQVPQNMDNYVVALAEIGFRSTVTGQWVEYDGIQVVKGKMPTAYDPEDSLFATRRGDDKYPMLNNNAQPISVGEVRLPNDHKITTFNEGYIHMWKHVADAYTSVAMETCYVTDGIAGTNGDIKSNTTQMVGYENLPAGKWARWQMRSIAVSVSNNTYGSTAFTWNQQFASVCDSAWAQCHDSNSYIWYASVYAITRTGGTCYVRTINDTAYTMSPAVWLWGIGD
jgi:Alanine-zipper, major outer membrane lipoprotein